MAGRLRRRPGSRSRYEADLRQWHASEMARSGSHDVFFYATQYGYSVVSTLIERVLRFSWVSTYVKGCFAAPWVELRRLLSESQSSSSERRRTHGTPKMNSWPSFEGSSTSAIVQRQRPAPGQVMLYQQQLEQAPSFDPGSYNPYRVTTRATATRLSLVVWHVWRFLVRYNNRGRRRRVDQNDCSSLSLFFHF